MRILSLHNQYRQPGGEDTEFAAEAVLLREHGHEVIKCVDNNARIGSISRFAVAANTIWSSAWRDKLLKVIRMTEPDVAHFHNIFPLISPAAYYACRKSGVPVVQTLQNYRLICPSATFYRDDRICEDCLGKTPPWPGVLHRCYRGSRVQTAVVAVMLTVHRWLRTWQQQVNTYVALTEFARGKFIEAGLPARKILVKPNIIHPDPGVRMGKDRYVLFLGRLTSEKGLETLLQSWRSLSGIPLKVAGQGPLMEKLDSLIQTRGDIELLGWRSHDQALELLARAYLLVFPSEWYEGFPLTISEAFACGTPVVASRLGAMGEIIEDGRTGLHFTSGDPEDLARVVGWAWAHPIRVKEMGQEARREFEEKYTAERNHRMLMTIYTQAMMDAPV